MGRLVLFAAGGEDEGEGGGVHVPDESSVGEEGVDHGVAVGAVGVGSGEFAGLGGAGAGAEAVDEDAVVREGAVCVQITASN